jgi:hypothetical protein
VDSAKDQKTKFLYHLRFKTQRLPEIPLPCVGICAGGTWPNYILEVRHDVEARIEPYVIVRLQNCFASLDAWRARCE